MSTSKSIRCLWLLLLCLASAASAQAQTSTRSLDEWMATNQSYPDILWYDNGAPAPAPRVYFDLFGRENMNGGLGLGTTVDGSIMETVLPGGRARVHVMIHESHVMTFATVDQTVLIFGHRAPEIAQGADPALADLVLTIDFEVSEPGVPLPSLHALFFDKEDLHFQLEKLGLVAQAEGTLRSAYGVADGTPGELRTTQRDLENAPGMQKDGRDQYPAEKVEIRVRP